MKPPTLAAVLRSLIAQSIADHAETTCTLSRGLTVAVHVQASKFTLRTWRPRQVPDLTEWQICYQNLPTEWSSVSRPEPIEFADERGTRILSASWPVARLF